MRKNSRPTIHLAFTLLQTLKTPMKHSWNASSAAIWLSRGSSRKPTASSSVNFPGTIRWNRHPLRMRRNFLRLEQTRGIQETPVPLCRVRFVGAGTRADGVLVGKAGLTDGELGYHIYEPFRRQGYALEACRAIVKYGFETLELDKIRLRTKRSNTASRILAEKMGFVQVPSFCKDSIVFCMQRGYNNLYTNNEKIQSSVITLRERWEE